jgi:antitoxin (DNA-binding transcriptional repressor) of toxin-antitoxin stability system
MINFLTYYLSMIRLNIHQIRTQFSKYVELVEGGETILICRRNLPVAEIRSIRDPSKRKPVLGAAKGMFEIGPAFDEPLPDDVLRAFDGDRETPDG